jgi:hypothetical protein
MSPGTHVLSAALASAGAMYFLDRVALGRPAE